MSIFIVDIEADGPIPGDYSMISLGACRVDDKLETTFGFQARPISEQWVPEALAVSGFTREQTKGFPEPIVGLVAFEEWVKKNSNGRPTFMSDNNGFDWMFWAYYSHHFLQRNIFGFSSRRIGDVFAGLTKEFRNTNDWKKWRRTAHTHNPEDDAKGNAEALLKFRGLGITGL